MVNTLFLGKRGLSMLDEAYDMASSLLQTDNLNVHPDYLYIDIPKDKKSIGVDEIMPVVQKNSLKPVLAEQSVVIINNMDCLTEAAQNKLLLTLESNTNVVIIGVAYRDNLLSTVKSRMKVVTYRPYTKNAFVSLYEGVYSPREAELLFYATGGCPGGVSACAEYLDMFSALYDTVQGKELHKLLSLLHLVKEKDPLAVSNDKGLLLSVLHVLTYAFVDKAMRLFSTDVLGTAKLVSVLDRLITDEAICQVPQYTKDNFFQTVVYLIEGGAV